MYRVLCGVCGAIFTFGGLALVLGFFRALAPGGEAPGPFVMGPSGVYFMGFAGCALIGWGGGLFGAARRPESARTIGTATALALVLAALCRIAGWVLGDFAYLGDVLRAEAFVMLLVALAFVWLRPRAGAHR